MLSKVFICFNTTKLGLVTENKNNKIEKIIGDVMDTRKKHKDVLIVTQRRSWIYAFVCIVKQFHVIEKERASFLDCIGM